MDIADSERIKHRDIAFQEIHPNPDQAKAAARFLIEVDGILSAAAVSPRLLHVQYDVFIISLLEIEAALIELGLHLDTNLLSRLKRALHYYTEETARANADHTHCESNCTDKLFAKRYELIEHGCRDTRPEHWRQYL